MASSNREFSMKHVHSSHPFPNALASSLLAWFVLLLSLCCSSVSAKNVQGIELKDSIKLGEQQLLLNGAGKRSKYFFDLYIAALYLPEASNNAQEIVTSDETMMIQIHVTSDLITSENLMRGTSEGFDKATGGQTDTIASEIADFLDAFNAPIKTGDYFDIVYQARKGITVLKNRKITKKLTYNLEFKQALFGIWLSEQPAQESLKNSLLGKEK